MSKAELNGKNVPTRSDFESLLVNNNTLSKIHSHIYQFNPIKVMKMERMEIRHSAILTWLFDPRESHGFEDKFLKAFLAEALRGHEVEGGVTALDIARADLRDALVRAEWQNIDIFVSCEFEIKGNKTLWTFIIENKFHSKQYDGQLSKYREKIESIFDIGTASKSNSDVSAKLNGIYLTLNEDPPEDTLFAIIHYTDVLHLLRLVIEQNQHKLTREVQTFLIHYLNILDGATGMSKKQTEMEKLAREVYLDHKNVIDFIIEHGVTSDFSLAVHEVFKGDPEYLDLVETDAGNFYFNNMGKDHVSFIPEGWCDAFDDNEIEDELEWPGCENWWAAYPLICWMGVRADTGEKADGKKGRIYIYAEVGPLSNHSHRKDLINRIKRAAEKTSTSKLRFQSGADKEGKKYSKFLKANTMHISDVFDSEEIASAMLKLLKKFEPEFKAISKSLNGFHEYGHNEK